jgi:hypothetical protein
MKRAAVIAAAAGLIVALLALFVAPGPHRLGTAADGDATLADRVRQIAGDDARGYRGLQVGRHEQARGRGARRHGARRGGHDAAVR